jgi:hypothetical protein
VGNESTGLVLDEHVKKLHTMMKGHEGYQHCVRHVCKSEWAYELAFVFENIDSFKAWKECELRDSVHSVYLDALKETGIKEEDVYGGVRVHDVIH